MILNQNLFCVNCGSSIPNDYTFCSKCGTHVRINNASSQTIDNASYQQPEDAQYDINRSENQFSTNMVQKKVKFADSGERLFAFIIDAILINIIISIITSSLGLHFGNYDIVFDWCLTLPYYWIFAFSGQTIGQMVLKIKVVDDQYFEKPDILHAFLHAIGKVFFLLLDIIIGFFIFNHYEENHGYARASQRISKTCVIKL